MKTAIRLLLVTSFLVAFTPPAARAADVNPAAMSGPARPKLDASTCAAFPSQATCDFQEVGVCSSDAVTLADAVTGSPFRVRVFLRYSSLCQSAWARATNLDELFFLNVSARIRRNDGATTMSMAFYPDTDAKSKMLFIGPPGSLLSCARAIGSLEGIQNGSPVSQARTPCEFPN